ncbi:tRNA/rRNA methyltransferase [Mycoplasmopsis californica]|uniref:RNA methyltransferase n=1 Tax=Mycoplasmopsis equigenitalium TaxID=114883 RepID=A0ABY5J538_9BACT|nr:RNA methyltransferase [Mycoplasmopsis equigenitalium]UUD36996.1 RNA methyltransferase [Mycoplasmopsis equigenitalium]VEU69706.1 tRNA/rRNA methyltransferase [Mycoplasmopsis californica]
MTKNEIKYLKKLNLKKYRYEENKFIIEGIDAINEAKSQNIKLKIYSSNPQNKPDVLITNEEINQILNSKTPQDIFALCEMLKPKEISGLTIVLDNIQDPGNLGTIIRNCVAFGVTNIIINGVDLYNDKTLRASKGSIFKINITQTKDLESFLLKLKRTHKIVGTLLDKSAKDIKELKNENYCIVFGNEANGISPSIIKLLDEKYYIPIKFESLNVAIANAIVLYELKRGKDAKKV